MVTRHLTLLVFCLPFFGCSVINRMSDQDLADRVYTISKGASQYGIKYLIDKQPEKAAEIKQVTQAAIVVIRTNVIPAFSGAETNNVLRSAADTALKLLGDKLDPRIATTVQLAVNLAESYIDLPANPTDKLDVRTKMALLALFNGLADGLNLAIGSPATSATASKSLKWSK